MSIKRNALTQKEMQTLILKENPEKYEMVECLINELIIIIQTRPDWAPIGQKRFIDLVNDRYYDGCALFRAIKNFIVQFGLASTKAMRDKWGKRELNIEDDPKIDIPFTRGIMSFAGGGKHTRGTQIFFTLAQISHHLGKEAWEVPFAKIIYGDDVLSTINTQYDDNVSQGRIWRDGYDYLHNEFPNLSYIDYCRVINQDEINYYLNNNDNNHDLQKELLLQTNNNNNNNNQMIISLLEISAGIIGVILCIFIIVKFVRKTPDKNN